MKSEAQKSWYCYYCCNNIDFVRPPKRQELLDSLLFTFKPGVDASWRLNCFQHQNHAQATNFFKPQGYEQIGCLAKCTNQQDRLILWYRNSSFELSV